MTRLALSVWRAPTLVGIGLLLALGAGSAFAQKKPSLAVLNLEVVDASGNIDAESTGIARDLSNQLRNRAQTGNGPYELTGGPKELIDEKLIKGCDNEAPKCMASIGKDMKADLLLYGRIEKKDGGHLATLTLLNVSGQKVERKATHQIDKGQRDMASISRAAQKIYNELAGITDVATINIKTNADRGTVLIDGKEQATITSGSATLSGLPAGKYRIAIEADGYKRRETTVTVKAGETASPTIELEEDGSAKVTATDGEINHEIEGTTSKPKSNVWKGVFWGSVAATAAFGGLWAVSAWQGSSRADDVNQSIDGGVYWGCDAGVDDELCGYHKRTVIGIVGTSVSGVVLLFSGYKTFFAGESPSKATASRRVRKPPVAVTPIVAPNGGGATVRIDF